jgi:hypothetical protein
MSRKGFITIGSLISVGFGLWHFFIPSIWNWYSYIDPLATELMIAVRAMNIFFSLLLVLLGIANIIVVFRVTHDRFTYLVLISISVILWATRVILQIIYPQGSQNQILQYCMLSIFIFVLLCYLMGLFFIIKGSENII